MAKRIICILIGLSSEFLSAGDGKASATSPGARAQEAGLPPGGRAWQEQARGPDAGQGVQAALGQSHRGGPEARRGNGQAGRGKEKDECIRRGTLHRETKEHGNGSSDGKTAL